MSSKRAQALGINPAARILGWGEAAKASDTIWSAFFGIGIL
jgi:hypothetical protein